MEYFLLVFYWLSVKLNGLKMWLCKKVRVFLVNFCVWIIVIFYLLNMIRLFVWKW